LSSPAKAGDPVFQKPGRLDHSLDPRRGGYWMPRLRGA
jgi:hypothetical protein